MRKRVLAGKIPIFRQDFSGLGPSRAIISGSPCPRLVCSTRWGTNESKEFHPRSERHGHCCCGSGPRALATDRLSVFLFNRGAEPKKGEAHCKTDTNERRD